MCAYVCRHMHMHVCRDWKCQDLLEVHSQAVMSCSLLVLERKLESSAKVARAPNSWTVVPAQRTDKQKEGSIGKFYILKPVKSGI